MSLPAAARELAPCLGVRPSAAGGPGSPRPRAEGRSQTTRQAGQRTMIRGAPSLKSRSARRVSRGLPPRGRRNNGADGADRTGEGMDAAEVAEQNFAGDRQAVRQHDAGRKGPHAGRDRADEGKAGIEGQRCRRDDQRRAPPACSRPSVGSKSVQMRSPASGKNSAHSSIARGLGPGPSHRRRGRPSPSLWRLAGEHQFEVGSAAACG